MLSDAVSGTDDGRHRSHAIAGVLAGTVFAAAAKSFVPLGTDIDSGAARASLLFAIGLCGLFASAQAGLRLWPESWSRSARIGVAAAICVAAFIIVLDCFLFRGILAPSYLHTLREPLSLRLVYYAIRAFMENTVYRLFAMPLLALAIGTIWHKPDGTPANGAFRVAIVLVQTVNIGWNIVPSEPVTPLLLFYDAIRYVAPGCLWGYLFWRHGFATAEIASVGTHFFLQPAFSIFLN